MKTPSPRENKHTTLSKGRSLGWELQTENQEFQVCSQTDRALLAGTEKVLVIRNNYSINVTLFISVAEWAGRWTCRPSHHRNSEMHIHKQWILDVPRVWGPKLSTSHPWPHLRFQGDLNGLFFIVHLDIYFKSLVLRELAAVVVQEGSAVDIKGKQSIAALLSERMLDTARAEQNQVVVQNPTV